MERRNFLSTVALALQAPERIGIALMGGSHSHGLAKAKVLLEDPSYRVAGIWEPDAKVRVGFEALGIRSLEREELLGDRSIVAVAVEGDVAEQGKDGLAALQAGKHVHVEKPGGPSHAVFLRMVAEAQRRRLQLQTGYMWRYNPGFVKVVEAARRGWLGEIYQMHGMMNTLILAERRPDWARFPGGQMFEMGGYMVDVMTRVLGKPDKVTPFLRRDGKYEDRLEDNTAAVLEFGRAMGIIRSTTLQPGAGAQRCLEVYGTKGNAVLRPIEEPVLEIDLVEAVGPYKKGRQRVELPKYQRYVADFEDLAAAIRGQKKLVVSATAEALTHETLMRACGG